MPESLISLVMQQFAPSIVQTLAGALGQSPENTERAISGAVPAVLAGLVGAASTPGGAGALAAAAEKADLGGFGNLSGMIGGSDQEAISDKGRSLLTSLLGGSALHGLTNAIGRFAGLSEGGGASLIGLVAAVVMGVIGRRQSEAGLNAGGVARMLLDDKDAIAGAMPAGLRKLLGGSGILDGIADRLGEGVGASTSLTGSAASAAGSKISNIGAAVGRAGIPGWAYGLGALIVLGLLGYWLWGGQGGEQTAQQASEQAVMGSSAPKLVMVGQVDLGRQITGALDTAAKSLKGVTDVASAKAALPQLKEAVSQLDQVSGLAGQVPAEGKKVLAGMVGSATPGLQQLIDKSVAIPGVAEVLKPTLDTLKDKLRSIGAEA